MPAVAITKFVVTKVSELGSSDGNRVEINNLINGETISTHIPVRIITMSAVHDQTTFENTSFAQATPSGTIEFYLNNSKLSEEFTPGSSYYVSFTPIKK